MERMTQQRKDILEAISSLHHASFDEINSYLISNNKAVNLSTIYRNLISLENEKFIRKVDFNKEILFELTSLEEHNHFYCENCKKVIDIFPKRKRNVKIIDGHLVKKASINYYGICQDCLKKVTNS